MVFEIETSRSGSALLCDKMERLIKAGTGTIAWNFIGELKYEKDRQAVKRQKKQSSIAFQLCCPATIKLLPCWRKPIRSAPLSFFRLSSTAVKRYTFKQGGTQYGRSPPEPHCALIQPAGRGLQSLCCEYLYTPSVRYG